MKANEFIKKYGWDNAELLLNSSKTIQQRYFRKLKIPCGDVVDAEELMSLVLDKKTREKVSRIGFNNLKEFVSVFEINGEAFGSSIVDSCYLIRLKRLIESHELVESYGGLDSSKSTVNYPNFLNDEDVKTTNHRLSKAILDVESCQ